MTKLVSLAAGLAIAAGCADQKCDADSSCTPGPELLPDLEVPPVPENGLQVITPIVRDLQPGTDNEICTWTDAITDREVDLRSVLGSQTEPGHHIVVYYTTLVRPAGTQRPCTDNDMVTLRFVIGTSDGVSSEAPGDLIYRIPRGAQIVINHHYLNAGDEVRDGQSLVNLYFADPGHSYQVSSPVAFVDSQLTVEPGIRELEVHCTMDRKLALWHLTPHMHRWGTNIKVDVIAGGVMTRMFDTDWTDYFTFEPPEKRFDPATPFVLAPGDEVRVHCAWNNDTGAPLSFGFEMCIAFGQFVDSQQLGGLICDRGHWGSF